MSPGVCCKEGNRRQGIRLDQSRGLNSNCKKCPRYCTQHPGIIVSGTSDTLNFHNPPLLGELYVHFFDQIDMRFSPRIPCSLSLSIRHSVSLLERKQWLATANSWILVTVMGDLYSFAFQSAHLCHSFFTDLFTSYLDTLKLLMKTSCFHVVSLSNFAHRFQSSHCSSVPQNGFVIP